MPDAHDNLDLDSDANKFDHFALNTDFMETWLVQCMLCMLKDWPVNTPQVFCISLGTIALYQELVIIQSTTVQSCTKYTGHIIHFQDILKYKANKNFHYHYKFF